MKMLLGMACCLMLLVCSIPGLAEPLAEEQRRLAAHAFSEGQVAFEQGDVAGALRHFERAFEIGRHDAVRFNIAVCLERLDRNAEAAEQYEAAASSTILEEATRERARQAAQHARSKLGRLVIERAPEGSTLHVDGRAICPLPCSPGVDSGSHEVVVRWETGEHRELVSVLAGRAVRMVVPSASPEDVRATKPPEVSGAEKSPQQPRTTPNQPTHLPEASESSARQLGLVGWGGAALAAGGALGTTYFGLRTQSLREDYDRNPTLELAEQGDRSRNLTNASLAVGLIGVALVAIDLFFLRASSSSKVPTTAAAWSACGPTCLSF